MPSYLMQGGIQPGALQNMLSEVDSDATQSGAMQGYPQAPQRDQNALAGGAASHWGSIGSGGGFGGGGFAGGGLGGGVSGSTTGKVAKPMQSLPHTATGGGGSMQDMLNQIQQQPLGGSGNMQPTPEGFGPGQTQPGTGPGNAPGSAIGMENLGPLIERLMGNPSAFGSEQVSSIRDSMKMDRARERKERASAINTDAARRGVFHSSIPSFGLAALEGELSEREALADAQLTERAAQFQQTGQQQSIDNAFRFMGMGREGTAGLANIGNIASNIGSQGGFDLNSIMGMISGQGGGGGGGGGGNGGLLGQLLGGAFQQQRSNQQQPYTGPTLG